MCDYHNSQYFNFDCPSLFIFLCYHLRCCHNISMYTFTNFSSFLHTWSYHCLHLSFLYHWNILYKLAKITLSHISPKFHNNLKYESIFQHCNYSCGWFHNLMSHIFYIQRRYTCYRLMHVRPTQQGLPNIWQNHNFYNLDQDFWVLGTTNHTPLTSF